jgi:endogenous inhibitor of DNA gyrase (YacG/DUF329 family)
VTFGETEAAFTFHTILHTFVFMPKCPTCGKPVDRKDNEWRPFCSERCKLIDFDKWTSEEYRVPGQRINPGDIPAQPAAHDNQKDEE